MTDISEKEKIKALLDERMQAIHDRKPDIILAMYVEDIATFDFKEPLMNKGINAVKERLEEWFATYKSPINQEIKMLEIMLDENIAFSYCLTRTYGTSIKGEEQDMWYRTTTGFKKLADKWLITHEHVSDPVDMETGKIIFTLKP